MCVCQKLEAREGECVCVSIVQREYESIITLSMSLHRLTTHIHLLHAL
jgi:hypothetical protein